MTFFIVVLSAQEIVEMRWSHWSQLTLHVGEIILVLQMDLWSKRWKQLNRENVSRYEANGGNNSTVTVCWYMKQMLETNEQW